MHLAHRDRLPQEALPGESFVLAQKISSVAWGFRVFAFTSGRADESAKGEAGHDGKAAPTIASREDVLYGRVHGAALTADVAWPESKEKLSAILSVHGGR